MANTVTIATIKRGEAALVGYKHFSNRCIFHGFYTDSDCTGPGFDSLRQLRSNVADSECYHALFEDIEGGYAWVAYFWNGRWRVGSSAHTLKMQPVEA
jgi:hypothetical protein